MFRVTAVGFLVLATTSLPVAASVSFDGLENGEQVLNYYDGGFGGNGSGPGPDYGITFTTGIAASSVIIAFGPSAVLTAPSVTMDLASPATGLSFYFEGAGTVTLYSGLNGTGTVVTTDSLTGPLPFDTSAGFYESVVFTGEGLRLDSISTGGPPVVPEPESGVLVLIAALLLGLAVRRIRGCSQ